MKNNKLYFKVKILIKKYKILNLLKQKKYNNNKNNPVISITYQKKILNNNKINKIYKIKIIKITKKMSKNKKINKYCKINKK